MKRLQIIFLLTIMLLTPKPALALFGVGDIVFDPAAFGEFVVAQGTRLGQLAQEVSTGTNAPLTTANTYLTMVNSTIFRPMQDAMMLISIFSSGEKIKALILGSVSGQTALLITNPERYIKQQGVNSLKVNYNYVSQADGIYSNSILDSVVAGARVKSDTAGRLASLSKSSIPKTIQDDLCEDNKLSTTAMNDVIKSDGTYDLDAYIARKQELDAALCQGDPNTDPALAQALTTAGEQTGAGGWGTFLAKTGGDNNYTRTSQALNVIEEDSLLKEATEAADLARGNGIVSKTECIKRSYDAKTGLDICVEKAIESPGYQLSESFKSAINAPLDILKNSYGTGGAVSSVLGSISSIVGTIGSMTSTVNSMKSTTSGLSTLGPNGDTSLQINTKGTPNYVAPTISLGGTAVQVNMPTNTTTSFAQDLAGNQNGKDSIIKPIKTLLNQHLKLLGTLEKSDTDYLAAISTYAGQLEDLNNCYQRLITDFPQETLSPINSFLGANFPSLANDPRVINALSYYTTKKSATNSLRAEITGEQNLIGETRTLITNTQSTITNSNSTEEISAAFDFYNTTVENNNLPSPATGAISREGDVLSYKTETNKDTANYFSSLGNDSMDGTITKLNRQCAAIRTEESTKRGNARAERDAAMNQSYGGGGGN